MRPSPRLAFGLRAAGSLLLLALVAWWLDLSEVAARLQGLDVRWVAAALGISVLQVAASAWRWRYTARRLGIELPAGAAFQEYYLATFLNQVLPGGVLGDVSRAWRHHRSRPGAEAGPVVRAVLLERGSGQVVMVAVAALSFLMLPLATLPDSGLWVRSPGVRAALRVGFAAVGAGLVGLLVRRREAREGGWSAAFRADLHEGLLAPEALAVQLPTSAFVVGSYLAMYLAAARAVGAQEPLGLLLPLVAPVLLAMLLPLTVAGWGAREGAAAAVWTSVGLSGAEGVAISVVYGLLVLVSSLPGAWVLLQALAGTGAVPGDASGADPTGTQLEVEEHVRAQVDGAARGA